MKYRTTKKAVINGYEKVVQGSYCAAQHILRRKDPVAYTAGVNGWNADVYELTPKVAFVTGYSPFGRKANYDIINELETKAKLVDLWGSEGETELEKIYNEFVEYIKGV